MILLTGEQRVGLLESAEILQAIFLFLFEEERCRLSLTTTRLLDRERLAESRAHWESLVSHLAHQAAEKTRAANAAADAALWDYHLFGTPHTGFSDSDGVRSQPWHRSLLQ